MPILLTTEECELVQASFAQMYPNADRVAALFYERLFALDPTLVQLFTVDTTLQGAKLMEKLALAVQGLEDLDAIAPFIRTLGRRHVAYGVKTKDYLTVGEALLWALEQQLGPTFGRAAKAAWWSAYRALSSIMIEAAEENVAS